MPKQTDNSYRNQFHYDVPSGWMNDPNGCIFAFGYYHIFYQHNPKSPFPDKICWGHVRTKDFISFETLPPALIADQPYDKDGCWSGSALFVCGKLYLMYTGLSDGMQQQCLAESDDGITFRKHPLNPIIPLSKLPPDSDERAFRDPWLFSDNEKIYLLLGGRNKKLQEGRIMLYESNDLLNWRYVNTLLRSSVMVDPGIFECPGYSRLGNEDLIIASLNFMPSAPVCAENEKTKAELFCKNFALTCGFIGSLDAGRGTFCLRSRHLLDYGSDYYAPQILTSPDGRRILIGWMQMWHTTYPTREHGWVGSLALPRQISVENGELRIRPAEELDRLFSAASEAEISGETEVTGLSLPTRFRIETEEMGEETTEIELHFGEDVLMLSLNGRDHLLKTDRSGFSVKPSSMHPLEEDPSVRFCPVNGKATLDIWADNSSIEIFADDGKAVSTMTVFPQTTQFSLRTGRNAKMKLILYRRNIGF